VRRNRTLMFYLVGDLLILNLALLAGRLLLDLQDGLLDDPVKQFWLRTAPDGCRSFPLWRCCCSAPIRACGIWRACRNTPPRAWPWPWAMPWPAGCACSGRGRRRPPPDGCSIICCWRGWPRPAVVLTRAACAWCRTSCNGACAGRARAAAPARPWSAARVTAPRSSCARWPFAAATGAPVDVVGVVSEDAAITGHDVHGIRVLGTCHELPALIRLHRVNILYLVESVDEAGLAQLRQMLKDADIRIIRWDIVETDVPLAPDA
jgi:hypothetical protein